MGSVPILDARVSVSRFGDDSFVVSAGGELDLYTSPSLQEAVQKLVLGRRVA